MNEISEYKTVQADNLQNLDAAVNRLIKDGFQPYGNLIVLAIGGQVVSTLIAQPMVKCD